MISSFTWKGNSHYPLLLERILTQSQGRLLIVSGEPGTGKTSLVLSTLAKLYGEDFLLSPSFQFFRPDDYDMKLSYYLSHPTPLQTSHLQLWGIQFLAHLSQLMLLKEIKTSHLSYKKHSHSLDEFRTLIHTLLRQQSFAKTLLEDEEFKKHILSLAEEITKKKSIPIAFIQEVIHFHQYTSDAPRLTFIGGWEMATLEAQNAALKLFEEMPLHSRIILQTNAIENVLPTIVSRSLVISLPTLSPHLVEEILGTPSSFSSCTLHMRESLFKEHSKASLLAKFFLDDLGFRVQYGDDLFDFVQQTSSSPWITQFFLDSLLEELRLRWLHHQKSIRGKKEPTTEAGKFLTYSSEVAEWRREILSLKISLKKSTLQPSYLLTDLLIKMARWMQKRKIS
ncbi:hypothetical protein BREVNS_1110 [Brevinematales bacterium NS]|nr:hypothetical protein BREVNS_1110 [Brevinematales bacterium NS]